MTHKRSPILLGGTGRNLWLWLFALVLLGLSATPGSADKSAARSLHNIGLIDQVLARVQPGQESVNIDDQLFTVRTLVGYRALLSGSLRPFSSFSVVARWPYGIVPYVYDSSVSDPVLRTIFESACREWEQQANVQFVPRTTQPNYVIVRSSDVNSSYVGMVGGAQELNIYNWNYKYIICHELAHALGAIHEQCRSDRDNYVSIIWDNIQGGTENNFAILSNSLDQGNYDFDSVMHYGLTSFSKNGQNTIQPKVSYNSLIGQRDHLSDNDKGGMVAIYGPPGPIQRPSNDDFANAYGLTGTQGTTTSNSVNASKQPGEYSHAGNSGGASLWYRWTAAASGPCTISTTGSTTPTGSIMDTLLGVYVAGQNSIADDPFSGLIEIAANDDEVVNSLYTSRVTFNAQAGVEYWIAVDGYNGTMGNINLGWQSQVPIIRPSNDNFQNAQLIAGEAGTISGTNVNATKEMGEPDDAASSTGASVWFVWTAPQTASYNFRVSSSFSALARVLQPVDETSIPADFNSLNQLAQLDVADSSMTFPAVQGSYYYIVVDGSDTATGTFSLTWKPAQVVTGHSLSGVIKTSINTPVANVAVQLSGTTSASSTTDTNGQYSFSGLAPGTYTVQPGSTAYTFGPPGWSITVDDEDLSGIDFLAVIGTTIGGRVTDKIGNGLAGVLVTCKGKRFSSSTSTSSGGFYAFPGMKAGTYTVKVSKSRVKFVPASRKVQLGTSSQTNTNFISK
ncbi:MAG TPA: M12 family metallopeptidase [Abditibacteriaceae bacterium]|jgi:hypothetical protein